MMRIALPTISRASPIDLLERSRDCDIETGALAIVNLVTLGEATSGAALTPSRISLRSSRLRSLLDDGSWARR